MDKKSILNDTPVNLIKKYQKLLRKRGVSVEKIILFGSYAKGTAKPWSDLDLCVVSKQFGKNGYDEMVFLNSLATDIESMIEPHPFHPKDLEDPYDPLAYEIRQTGKTVYSSQKAPIPPKVKKIIDRLVKNYKPEKIILFGSAVEGRMDKDSDLDIVIIKKTHRRFYDRIGEVLKTVRTITPKPPLDFLVYTPSEFERMRKESYFVKDEVVERGKVLYEKK